MQPPDESSFDGGLVPGRYDSVTEHDSYEVCLDQVQPEVVDEVAMVGGQYSIVGVPAG